MIQIEVNISPTGYIDERGWAMCVMAISEVSPATKFCPEISRCVFWRSYATSLSFQGRYKHTVDIIRKFNLRNLQLVPAYNRKAKG